MKIQSSVTKRTGDRITVAARWKDRFKKPAYIRVMKSDTPPDTSEDLLFSGDVKDTHGIIFGIAQVAWDMGWRPAGLLEHVMETIRSHKIPRG